MRAWTLRRSVADGRNWIVECDGRVMAMFDRYDEADAIFIVDACNAAEWTAENSEREADFHAPVSFIEGTPASHVDKIDDNPYHRP